MSYPAEVTVTRWSEGAAPREGEILRRLAEEGLHPYQWSNAPGDVYAAHRHRYDKVICVVRGAITFGLPERGDEVRLEAGDRLELPRNVIHDAVVGAEGVVCLEAHR